jgi:hypothetical protein
MPIINLKDGSINAVAVEIAIRRNLDPLRELEATLRRAGAAPMILVALENAIDSLKAAISEAKQLND